VLSFLLAFYHIFNSCHFSSIVVPTGVVEFCAQDYDDPFTSAWCMSVWPVATHKGKLTARRLVITFVPTAFRVAKSTASNASGAYAHSGQGSSSSPRTRSGPARTAGSSGSSPWARIASAATGSSSSTPGWTLRMPMWFRPQTPTGGRHHQQRG
jgi:hypothetical protein